MLGRLYAGEICSAARALEVVGERWSLLILRNAAFAGCTRFSEFERRLGIATNVLSSRLDAFVAAGLMEVRPSPDHRGQSDYLLTEKGRDFVPVIVALTEWGDRWSAPAGPPMLYEHDACGGGGVHLHLRCEACDADVEPAEVVVRRGPGFPVTGDESP